MSIFHFVAHLTDDVNSTMYLTIYMLSLVPYDIGMITPNQQLKDIRLKHGITAYKAAEKLGITPQHLSRVENTSQAPSRLLLEQIIELYRIPLEDADNLRASFGFPPQMSREGQNVSIQAEPTTGRAGDSFSLKLDPSSTPIYFSNAMAITSDDYGVVLEAGQKVMSSNEIQIVARVGLSLEHAEQIHEQLGAHVRKLQKAKGDRAEKNPQG
jgi:transcriptional regulator with XRE-family HTH domain